MTENNSVINSCFGYFISRAENNVIPTAYLVIITDNLVAVCGNFIFNTDYSNIRCIGNSVLITVNKVILCSLSFSTGYFILYAGQLGVFSVISLVAAADCHYRTTCIFAGLHSFNCFLLCFSNRKLIPAIIININAFNTTVLCVTCCRLDAVHRTIDGRTGVLNRMESVILSIIFTGSNRKYACHTCQSTAVKAVGTNSG